MHLGRIYKDDAYLYVELTILNRDVNFTQLIGLVDKSGVLVVSH